MEEIQEIHEKCDGEIDPVLASEPLKDSSLSPTSRAKLLKTFGLKAESDDIAPSSDVQMLVDQMMALSMQDSIDILLRAMSYHQNDPNFPSITRDKIVSLLQGYKHNDQEESDWLFDLKAEAAVLYYHSPYPEVRSVTSPFDDTTAPAETLRAYFLGMIFMAASTTVNTFFAPRQPTIHIPSNVLQLLLAPCGIFWARFMPNWSLRFRGTTISLNPGPWSFKEQVFATIMFSVASGAGSVYYVYLVQKLPQYLNQKWVTFGYEIVLALAVQFFGFGFAGVLRRFVVFPSSSIFPGVLPTMALARTLVLPEKKNENLNGWTLTRYRFFLLAATAMFIWFFVPNFLFTALHSFNWMTWIAPDNFPLGMITGFYGGLGFNPIATLDWNVSGTNALVTPFFSYLQQYIARLVSGLIIIALYWGNYYWSAYLPINSNEAFANDASLYNVSRILHQNGTINIESYKKYGPPYFAGANVFETGSWFATYTLILSYVFIRYHAQMWHAYKGMWRSMRRGTSVFADEDDAHCRAMRRYPEVPDWWFLAVLLGAFVFGVIAVEVWPTHTPWWSLIGVILMSAAFAIPAALLLSVANVATRFNVLWQTLAGAWFGGNAEAQIIITSFGQNFLSQSDNYISDLKLAHYAKLPPRAVFRAQMIATFLNAFIFIGLLNWMVAKFDNGTLCEWDNAQHFVCTDAVLVFASAIEFGAFGTRNFFALYPILPWCFLMGLVAGVLFAVGQLYGPRLREWSRRVLIPRIGDLCDKWFFAPLSAFATFNPAVCVLGSHNWVGGNNLSYATNGLYLSCIFMFYIKRRYPAWWQKYNYILEAGFDVGVAVSGIIQTFAFAFGPHRITLNWWGNTVSQQGVDYLSYKQKGSLYPLPEKRYFGLDPEEYPTKF